MFIRPRSFLPYLSVFLLFNALLLLPALAQKQLFSNDSLMNEAKRLALSLQQNASINKRTAEALDWKGREALKRKSNREALSYFKTAAGKTNLSKFWLNLSNTWLTTKTQNYRERSDFPQKAAAAAYHAFVNAQNNDDEALSLFALGKALEKRSMWRLAMESYKASLIRQPSPIVSSVYQNLKDRKGFRITDYSVDSDSLTPRLCITFSEDLSKDEKDYAKYVRLEQTKAAAITMEDKKICIDGLEHGQRYRATVRAGVPNHLGEKLEKTSNLSVYVKDRTPSLRFSGKSYVLPRFGQQGIPLLSVNLDKADIDLYRVGDRALSQTLVKQGYSQKLFGRQLEGEDFSKIKNGLGQHIWHKTLIIHKALNKDSQTAIPISEEIEALKQGLTPGVYVLRAGVPNKTYNQWDNRATQWFIISDLGLTAFSGNDGIHAFVRSIGTALPQQGVTVQLMAKNNEVLGSATTDKNGYARFAAGLTRGEGGQRPGLLTARVKGLDYAFLDMSATAFDLSDRGVSGRKAPSAIDSFLFTERGVYRPGSTVHVVALARDQKTQALQNMPFTLLVMRPDGVEYKRQLLKDEGLGGHSYDLALPASVQTGAWRIKLHSDLTEDPVAEASFLVEDFEPEKLKLSLKAQDKQLTAQKPTALNLNGAYLYGAPAGNMAIEAEIAISKASSPPARFKGYHFGMENENFSTVRQTLSNLPMTDKEGHATIKLKLPKLQSTSRLLKANVTVRLRESSGRTIERNITLPVAPQNSVIGIKPLFSGTLGEGQNAQFQVMVMDKTGSPTAYEGLHWELSHIDRSYQWYSRGGNWNYEPIVKTRRVAEGKFNALADKAVTFSAKVDWGSYRLDVYSKGQRAIASSYKFSAGWYQVNKEGDTPDLLEIGLDKKSYNIGDTLSVRLKPQSAGKALVTILNGGIIAKKLVDIPKQGGDVSFTITEAWGSGAYVAANFYRPINEKAKRMPSRSIGVQWVSIGKAARSLDLSLDTAKLLPSNSKLSVPVKINNLKAGEKVYIVASAVDVGILNLTRYKAPAPEEHFYAKRQLGVEMRDLYGRLIDGMQSVRGKLRSGGDGAPAGSYGITGSPPAQKPLARFSGIKEVNADGTLTIDFDIPDFAGTLKVMTVAWSKSRVGHSQSEVVIRDNLVISATTPKFMNVGDLSRLHIDIDNVDGVTGDYALNLISGGAVLFNNKKVFSQTIALKKGARKSWDIPMMAALKGTGFVAVELSAPDGSVLKRSYQFAVHPAQPNITTQTIHTIAPDSQLTLSKDLLVNLENGSGEITIAVAPSYLPDVPSLLMSLDRYPYGCTEQLTSRALPLLYLSDVAAQIGMKDHKKEEMKKRVQKAIDTILTRQTSEGAFGLWSARDSGLWLTAYVSDFFSRAREKGYHIPNHAFSLALDDLSNMVAISNVTNGGEHLAYALYVLARNKRARVGDLRYYADEKYTAFKTPLGLSQLASALAMYGDKERAQRLFRVATAQITNKNRSISRFNNYGSDLRDSAAMITLIAETGMSRSMLGLHSTLDLYGVMQQSIATNKRTTTQEQSWMLLAANALFSETKQFSLLVNGNAHQGAYFKKISAQRLLEGDFTLKNTGQSPARISINVTGTPISPEPAVTKGLEIERAFYSLEGKPITLSALNQNQRMVVVLKVHEAKGLPAEIMVADYLPAGFEIENPNLVRSADSAQLSWLKNTKLKNAVSRTKPVHTEFRNNRFTAAYTLKSSSKARSFSIAYMVRAVSPGLYTMPPAIVEDMYRPERMARTEAGQIIVK